MTIDDQIKDFIDWAKNDRRLTSGNLLHIEKKIKELFISTANLDDAKSEFIIWVLKNPQHFPKISSQAFSEALDRAFSGSSSKQAKTSNSSSNSSPTQREEQLSDIADKSGYIHFYKDGLTSFLGNFEISPITYNGVKYQCVEAAFQAQKFPGHESKFQSLNGEEAFTLKQKLEKTILAPTNWHAGGKDAVMQDLLVLKFQDPKLAKELLATKAAYLVEHNEKKGRDTYWSDDFDGAGRNMLGVYLMNVRGSLGGIGHVSCPQQYFDDLQKHQNELPVL